MPHPLPDEPTRNIARPHPPGPPAPVPTGREAPGETVPGVVPLADQPTDVVGPPAVPPRQPTMPMAPVATPAPVAPGSSQRSAAARRAPATASPEERGRAWPWVLLSLLVVLVIGGTGVALFLLLVSG